MTELDETLLALRALYARYKELEVCYDEVQRSYNAQTQCLVNVRRILTPPLPYRLKKLNLLRCIETAVLEIDGCNAQIMHHDGAGDSEHEAPAQQTGKVSRNVAGHEHEKLRYGIACDTEHEAIGRGGQIE